jgi:hypothetical protein
MGELMLALGEGTQLAGGLFRGVVVDADAVAAVAPEAQHARRWSTRTAGDVILVSILSHRRLYTRGESV